MTDHYCPQPPSLKEQALAALNVIEDEMLGPTNEEKLIRRALLDQPVVEGPTDEELLVLFDQFDIYGTGEKTHGMSLDTFWDEHQPREVLAFARAVLAKWGHQ